MTIRFFVAGIPRSQGSVTAMPSGAGQKPAYLYGKTAQAHKRVVEWRSKVSVAAAAHEPIPPGAAQLSVVFVLAKPPSTKRLTPAVAPDLDKLVRAIGDALEAAGVIGNDSRIVALRAYKVYQDERSLDTRFHTVGAHVRLETAPPGSLIQAAAKVLDEVLL